MSAERDAIERLLSEIIALWRRDGATGPACLLHASASIGSLGDLALDRPEPAASLGVLRHLDAALATAATRPLGVIAQAFAAAHPSCRWRQNANYIADPALAGFCAGYGYTEVIGDQAFVASAAVRAGFMLLAPETTYPSHHHPAEEVYHVLSGTAEWQRGSEPWHARPPGSAIHHPPHMPHATRTLAEPLLVLYCWTGAVATAAELSTSPASTEASLHREMFMPEQKSTTVSGRCLCGAVRFTLAGALRDVALCHCGQCRRWHGHVGAYTNVQRSALTFAAEKTLSWYRSSDFAKRGFCSACGSSLFWQRNDSDVISVAAGSLDAATGLATTLQIFTEDRGDYYHLDPSIRVRPKPAPA